MPLLLQRCFSYQLGLSSTVRWGGAYLFGPIGFVLVFSSFALPTTPTTLLIRPLLLRVYLEIYIRHELKHSFWHVCGILKWNWKKMEKKLTEKEKKVKVFCFSQKRTSICNSSNTYALKYFSCKTTTRQVLIFLYFTCYRTVL